MAKEPFQGEELIHICHVRDVDDFPSLERDYMQPIDRIELDIMLKKEIVNASDKGDDRFIDIDMDEESNSDEDDEENILTNEDRLSRLMARIGKVQPTWSSEESLSTTQHDGDLEWSEIDSRTDEFEASASARNIPSVVAWLEMNSSLAILLWTFGLGLSV
ncbi:hypothetical protein ACH5RR_007163 [Cinchona calisaya]|uniref:Uncharacterized protein n=1 Tax=Cinchona calisaya TaxID=153742 RepID=A0ABD3AQZ7_9GENT